jgi:porphyrinogen peroxidase
MSGKSWDRAPIGAPSIAAPLSRAAVFLVAAVGSDETALAKVSSALGGLPSGLNRCQAAGRTVSHSRSL